MTRIYLAGPMFCRSELDYNLSLREDLENRGYTLVLPQQNDTRLNMTRMQTDKDYRDAATIMIFKADLDLLDTCDALVINLDGRVPDEGACVELGYAYAKGKKCFGIKTDTRESQFGTDNLMIGGATGLMVAGSVDELVTLLRDSGL